MTSIFGENILNYKCKKKIHNWMNEDISRNPTANLTKTNSEPTQYGVHSGKFQRHISAGIFSFYHAVLRLTSPLNRNHLHNRECHYPTPKGVYGPEYRAVVLKGVKCRAIESS